MYSLLTMEEEGQPLDNELLGQKRLININNGRIRIQLGAKSFLLLWCVEIKSKEKETEAGLNQRTSKSI